MSVRVRVTAAGAAGTLVLALAAAASAHQAPLTSYAGLGHQTAAVSAANGTVGAKGIGDAYFPLDGNGGYDVTHYDIADTYDFASGDLAGTTAVTAVAEQDLTRFDLDSVLTIDSVQVDGAAASFRTAPHELVITPKTALADGQQFDVVVTYHGDPDSISYGGESPWNADANEVTATNEPHIAPWWFAVNDHPTDKATFDITVSVPSGNQVISNGSLVSHTTSGADTTWHWRMGTPIASYLAFFAAGSFAMRSGTSHGIPYTIAASRQLGDTRPALHLLKQTPGVVAWLASQFGDYPFSSTGGVITTSGQGFSLENASRPTYPDDIGPSTVVHELAHQWFGDDVSVHRWRDIWLNEGFASFSVWRYDETHGGEKAQHRLLRNYDAISAGDPFWSLEIGDPGAQQLFDSAVYVRGEMTLQALRHRIGGDDFFQVMRTWVADHGGANGSVQQFEDLATTISGKHLGGFFTNWLFTPSKPARTKANGFG